MPWYGWLLLVMGGVIAAAAIAFRLLRASQRGRQFLALSTRGKLAFGRELLHDPEVPIAAKAVVVILVAYLALPFDLIPDFIPVIGQLDDLLVVVGAIGLLILAVPRRRFESALSFARDQDESRRAARATITGAPGRGSPPG